MHTNNHRPTDNKVRDNSVDKHGTRPTRNEVAGVDVRIMNSMLQLLATSIHACLRVHTYMPHTGACEHCRQALSCVATHHNVHGDDFCAVFRFPGECAKYTGSNG